MDKTYVLTCPYCNSKAEFWQSSVQLYGKDYGPIYCCYPCKAWVGCHKGTQIPLGRIANKELREWKKRAHAAFDPLWKRRFILGKFNEGPSYSKSKARNAGYGWLAKQLGIKRRDCHIGLFDVEQCQKVVAICSNLGKRNDETQRP